MSGEAVDQAALADDLGSGWLAELTEADRENALALARKLVADWAREADPMPDPAAVVRYQREALEATTARGGGDKVQGLELELLRRRLDELNGETFKLAQGLVDGEIEADEAARRGRGLLEQCEQIASSLEHFGSNAAVDAMRRSLAEAMLDARYAVEPKAMSQRLAHARPEAGSDAGPDDGPPTVF